MSLFAMHPWSPLAIPSAHCRDCTRRVSSCPGSPAYAAKRPTASGPPWPRGPAQARGQMAEARGRTVRARAEGADCGIFSAEGFRCTEVHLRHAFPHSEEALVSQRAYLEEPISRRNFRKTHMRLPSLMAFIGFRRRNRIVIIVHLLSYCFCFPPYGARGSRLLLRSVNTENDQAIENSRLSIIIAVE